MPIFSKSPKAPKSYLPDAEDAEALLKDFDGIIDEIVEAVMSGDVNADMLIADAVEGEPELVRIAIVEKIRAALRERSEEKANALDEALTAQKLLAQGRQRRMMQAWLANFMSQETLRKLRESLLSSPSAKREVEHLGQELAKKGVLQNIQPKNVSELGSLSANVQQKKEQRQAKEPNGKLL